MMRIWCFKSCAPEAPGCSWQDTFTFEHETRFTILDKTFPFPKMATNLSNCTPKITMKKTKRHKLLFGVHWTGKTGLPKMRHAPLDTNLTVSSPMGLYCNNHIIYLPPNPTSWKLFVQCKLVTSVKDKSGHKIIIWKSTDTPVARNPWTVGWQVWHYATAERVQHTLVWEQKKKSYVHGYGTCMWQSRPNSEG